jgi:hypothetical protein
MSVWHLLSSVHMPMTKTLGDQDCLVNLNVALVINRKNLVVDHAK